MKMARIGNVAHQFYACNSANYVAVKQGIPDSITLPVILIGFGNIAALYLDVLFVKRGFGRLNAEVLTRI
jgi:hypothetical protein